MSPRNHDGRGPHDRPSPENFAYPFGDLTSSILEALPFGLFVLDRDGAPVYANQQSTRLLGLGPVKGLKPRDLSAAYATYVAGTDEPYPPDRMPIVKALRGERAFQNDMEVRRKDGSVYLEIEAAPVFGPSGEVNYAVAVFRDVTATRVMESELSGLVESLESRAIAEEVLLERVKESPEAAGELMADIAAALREAREDARIARNALSLFLANFSHELRTPLNHIIGFSDLIDQKLSRGVTDGVERHAANIRQSGANLLETLNRIIRFAELDTGLHADPELEIFVADDLLADVASWATPIAEQRGNSVRLKVDAPIGSIRTDSSYVESAMRQIVENACKHSKGRVIIAGERLGEAADARVRFVVSDEGPGMDPDLIRALLEGKVSPGDPLSTGGLGVGIPLAKRLVEAIGGAITAVSSPGGSTFVVELPALFRLPARQG